METMTALMIFWLTINVVVLLERCCVAGLAKALDAAEVNGARHKDQGLRSVSPPIAVWLNK